MMSMNRGIVVGILLMLLAVGGSLTAYGQGVQSYLSDRMLTATRFEVEVPHTSIWSFLGTKVTGRIRPREGTVLKVVSSAYASSPYQTDSTPCITAAGTTVRPGVVATNFLPLGTVVSINGKEYIVEDRMNKRYDGYYLDIWFPSTSEALEFGRKKIEITIVAYKEPGAVINPSPTPVPAKQGEKKGILQSISVSVADLSKFLFTKSYTRDPNAYDVDCSL